MKRRRPTYKEIDLKSTSSPLGETYYPVPGFDKYYCTRSGRIYTTKKGRIREIKGAEDKDGYLKTALIRDGKYFHFRKHRIIALTFLGESPLEVNHINGKKQDNRIENLEYVTLQENQCHRRMRTGFKVGVCFDMKMKQYRAYIQHDKKWEHLGFFVTEAEAKNAYLRRTHELGINNKYANYGIEGRAN